MRVLLDANILLSYLLPARSDSTIHAVVRAGLLGAYLFLLPDALLDEIVRKIQTKTYFIERVSQEELRLLVQQLQLIGVPIATITHDFPAVSRDPKDNYLLTYAVIGQADYLVTNDRDLLILREVEGVRIITPATFAMLLLQQEHQE